jgi:hypothetical protein
MVGSVLAVFARSADTEATRLLEAEYGNARYRMARYDRAIAATQSREDRPVTVIFVGAKSTHAEIEATLGHTVMRTKQKDVCTYTSNIHTAAWVASRMRDSNGGEMTAHFNCTYDSVEYLEADERTGVCAMVLKAAYAVGEGSLRSLLNVMTAITAGTYLVPVAALLLADRIVKVICIETACADYEGSRNKLKKALAVNGKHHVHYVMLGADLDRKVERAPLTDIN